MILLLGNQDSKQERDITERRGKMNIKRGGGAATALFFWGGGGIQAGGARSTLFALFPGMQFSYEETHINTTFTSQPGACEVIASAVATAATTTQSNPTQHNTT